MFACAVSSRKACRFPSPPPPFRSAAFPSFVSFAPPRLYPPIPTASNQPEGGKTNPTQNQMNLFFLFTHYHTKRSNAFFYLMNAKVFFLATDASVSAAEGNGTSMGADWGPAVPPPLPRRRAVALQFSESTPADEIPEVVVEAFAASADTGKMQLLAPAAMLDVYVFSTESRTFEPLLRGSVLVANPTVRRELEQFGLVHIALVPRGEAPGQNLVSKALLGGGSRHRRQHSGSTAADEAGIAAAGGGERPRPRGNSGGSKKTTAAVAAAANGPPTDLTPPPPSATGAVPSRADRTTNTAPPLPALGSHGSRLSAPVGTVPPETVVAALAAEQLKRLRQANYAIKVIVTTEPPQGSSPPSARVLHHWSAAPISFRLPATSSSLSEGNRAASVVVPAIPSQEQLVDLLLEELALIRVAAKSAAVHATASRMQVATADGELQRLRSDFDDLRAKTTSMREAATVILASAGRGDRDETTLAPPSSAVPELPLAALKAERDVLACQLHSLRDELSMQTETERVLLGRLGELSATRGGGGQPPHPSLPSIAATGRRSRSLTSAMPPGSTPRGSPSFSRDTTQMEYRVETRQSPPTVLATVSTAPPTALPVTTVDQTHPADDDDDYGPSERPHPRATALPSQHVYFNGPLDVDSYVQRQLRGALRHWNDSSVAADDNDEKGPACVAAAMTGSSGDTSRRGPLTSGDASGAAGVPHELPAFAQFLPPSLSQEVSRLLLPSSSRPAASSPSSRSAVAAAPPSRQGNEGGHVDGQQVGGPAAASDGSQPWGTISKNEERRGDERRRGGRVEAAERRDTPRVMIDEGAEGGGAARPSRQEGDGSRVVEDERLALSANFRRLTAELCDYFQNSDGPAVASREEAAAARSCATEGSVVPQDASGNVRNGEPRRQELLREILELRQRAERHAQQTFIPAPWL